MPEVKVYLAISEAIYKSFFSGEGIQIILTEEEVSYFVVDLKSEVIVLWEN